MYSQRNGGSATARRRRKIPTPRVSEGCLPSFGPAGVACAVTAMLERGKGKGQRAPSSGPGKHWTNENGAPRQLHELLNPRADLLDRPHPMISLAPRQAQSWTPSLAPPRTRRTRDNGPFGLALGRIRGSPGGVVGRYTTAMLSHGLVRIHVHPHGILSAIRLPGQGREQDPRWLDAEGAAMAMAFLFRVLKGTM